MYFKARIKKKTFLAVKLMNAQLLHSNQTNSKNKPEKRAVVYPLEDGRRNNFTQTLSNNISN